jgi:hypothetical protein
MKAKYLYLVDYFAPPSHSDGGLLNVIAEDDDECFDLIVEWDDEMWAEHYGKLRENIVKARRFELMDYVESEVVEAFVT